MQKSNSLIIQQKGLNSMLVEIMKFGREERAGCTSLDVAETFGKDHFHVLRDIDRMECSKEFRESNFGLSEYTSSQNKKLPMYCMTRDGFTILVMGYTGELAMKFKEGYIKQFNAMETALQGKVIERQKGIAVRQALTKALQQSGENERMHNNGYPNYTNCIYKVLFGMNAAQLREKFGLKKRDGLRDCFTQEELRAIQSMECLVSGLLDCGWGYNQIKEFIQENNAQRQLIA